MKAGELKFKGSRPRGTRDRLKFTKFRVGFNFFAIDTPRQGGEVAKVCDNVRQSLKAVARTEIVVTALEGIKKPVKRTREKKKKEPANKICSNAKVRWLFH